MVQIPWPHTNAPGDEAQEGAGKLTNVFVERRGDEQSIVWRRVPGAKTFVVEPSNGALAGTASFFVASSGVESAGTIAGQSAVSGATSIIWTKKAVGSMNATASVDGERGVLIAAASTIAGDAAVTADSTV
jgi:hypothetical protein